MPLLSFWFVVIPLRDSKDRRQVHWNSAVSVSVPLLFCWPKMQGHSVLWKSFFADILHTNLLALKSRSKEEQKVKSSSRFHAWNKEDKVSARGLPGNCPSLIQKRAFLQVLCMKITKKNSWKAQASKRHLPGNQCCKMPRSPCHFPALNFPSSPPPQANIWMLSLPFKVLST